MPAARYRGRGRGAARGADDDPDATQALPTIVAESPGKLSELLREQQLHFVLDGVHVGPDPEAIYRPADGRRRRIPTHPGELLGDGECRAQRVEPVGSATMVPRHDGDDVGRKPPKAGHDLAGLGVNLEENRCDALEVGKRGSRRATAERHDARGESHVVEQAAQERVVVFE